MRGALSSINFACHGRGVNGILTTCFVAISVKPNYLLAMTPEERKRQINRKAVAKYRAKHISERKAYDAAKRAANLQKIRLADRNAKKRWYLANTEEARARARKYAAEHQEQNKTRAKAWREANPERFKALALKAREKRKLNWDSFLQAERKRYRKNYIQDPAKTHAKSAARRAQKLQATPNWADLAAIDAIYRNAQKLSVQTGTKHDVDHIVPLKGKNVSGLHVHHNLRIVPAAINRRKFNKLDPMLL